MWRDIETAPRDGTLVDLWGYDRDPDPKIGGILLPLELSLGRWVNCSWSSPLTMRPGATLLMPLEPAWYQVTVDLSPGAVNRVRRIWPTHWMPLPEPPK